MTPPLFDLSCAACGRAYPASGRALPPTCPACGGFWTYGESLAWEPPDSAAGPLTGLRAWAHGLGLDPGELTAHALARPPVRHAPEPPGGAPSSGLAPVWISHQGSAAEGGGSFKERGAEILAAACARRGLDEVYLDSSGNAGIAMARACAERGIACRVLVPESTPRSKLERLRALGAGVERIAGDRRATHLAALERLDRLPYASHIVQPFFQAGVATLAWELFEELGRSIERILLPVGNGSLLLGLALGFERLRRAGRIDPVPRLHAVQLAGYASLAPDAAGDGPDHRGEPPRAAGIAIADPPRRTDMAARIEESGGDVTVVPDDEIAAARDELTAAGLATDPTGATAWAGLKKRPELVGEGTVVILTSTG